MTDEERAADREALTDLLESRGWTLYQNMVMREITGQFENDITRALDHPDQAIALDRMRQVAFARKQGLRWLDLPKTRLNELTKQDRETPAIVGRRPTGL